MKTTRMVTFIGILSALSFILYIIEFPLFIYFPPYLKIDLGDVPAIFGAIALGPVAGIIIEVVKNILHFLLRSTTPFASGEIGNFAAGVGLLIPIAVMLRKNNKNTWLPYVVGAISMTIIANVINYFITLPLYGIPEEAIWPTIISYLVPFNLIKATVVSIVIAILYGKMRSLFEKFAE